MVGDIAVIVAGSICQRWDTSESGEMVAWQPSQNDFDKLQSTS